MTTVKILDTQNVIVITLKPKERFYSNPPKDDNRK